MLGLKAICDLIDFLQESDAILLAIRLWHPLRFGESMIAVKPVDDLQRAIDRLEVAALQPLEELQDHLLKPGDLKPGEVFSRGDPPVAQFLTQDALGSLRRQPLRRSDFVDAGACDEGSENPLGAGDPCAFRAVGGARVGHGRLEGVEKARALKTLRFARIRGGKGRGGVEDERDPVRPQLSNLPHYAVTGVKAQAFVLVLF
jgi:hypothetical protein